MTAQVTVTTTHWKCFSVGEPSSAISRIRWFVLPEAAEAGTVTVYVEVSACSMPTAPWKVSAYYYQV